MAESTSSTAPPTEPSRAPSANVEIVPDETVQNAQQLHEWARLLNEACRAFGKEFGVTKHYKQWMIDAGFKNVKEEVYKVPINPWPEDRQMKELGRYSQVNALESMESYSLALFTRVLGWKPQEVQVFLAGVRQELMDRSLHIYAKHYFVYGQKEE
ncbi:Methyltransferase [Aspergillus sp. HF37]|nr:Methyltransferase [Aspergillus sp. HF37]